MDNPKTSLRRIASIDLPSCPHKPGPLHTVVADEAANIYYSDELNHTVVSLDRTGKLRWFTGGRGSEPGQFWYPKGLALGFTSIETSVIPCLAVADSWNMRVQFFTQDGCFLTIQTSAWGGTFAETTDVRFIIVASLDHQEMVDGYWLVLDRGNHRLCILGMDGGMRAQIGRCVDPQTENRWRSATLADLMEKSGGSPPELIPYFDALYYPARILGHSEEALYVWEPLSRKLKGVVQHSQFIVPFSGDNEGQCFAADGSGFLKWLQEAGRIRRYDHNGELREEYKAEGILVPSNLSSDRFWVQVEDRLECWQLAEGTE